MDIRIPKIAFVISIFLFIPAMLTIPFSFSLGSKNVVVIKLDGVINVATLDLIKEGMDDAHRTSATAIVLLLDTPGGVLDATFDIIGLIEQSSIPVISFVHPKGATAWSAGTFIVLSSHVAAMAPHSILGACQPRAYPSGELIDDPKLINSLTEFLVQRAEIHDRNETIAARFVNENLNIGAEDAKNYNVIEKLATTVEKLLNDVDGIEVEVAERGQVTIQTKNAEIRYFGPSIRVRALRILSDPNIAYLLFILGVWGLIFGFLTKGFEGEIVGGILLILGLIGLGFYVDLFVAILLILGGILVFVEMREPGLEFFGPAGVLCLLVGSLLLLRFDPARWSISPGWYWSFLVIVIVLVAILTFFSALILYKLFKSAKKRPTVLEFVGGVARTIDEIGPEKEGFVRFHGEYWRARSDTLIKPGEKVEIIEKDGLVLIVAPLNEK
jgi:membrane-bound serine protease (ClpP class)